MPIQGDSASVFPLQHHPPSSQIGALPFYFSFSSIPPPPFSIPSQDLDLVSLYQKRLISRHSMYHHIVSHHNKLHQIVIHPHGQGDLGRLAKAKILTPQPLKRSNNTRGQVFLCSCDTPYVPSPAPEVVLEARSPPRLLLPSSPPHPQSLPPSFLCPPPL